MPVRDWLLKLAPEHRKIIGEDIKTVEYGWPIGMPVSRPLGNGLHEVRSDLTNKTISRVIFTIYKNNMVLLHGFIKKDQKTSQKEMNIARSRLKKFSQEKGGKNEP
jgi:phage-related protein